MQRTLNTFFALYFNELVKVNIEENIGIALLPLKQVTTWFVGVSATRLAPFVQECW